MSNDKTRLIIQVPNDIIRNKDIDMDAKTFSVYTLMRFLLFRNYNDQEIEIDHNKLKHKLYISDNRTLKRVFKDLHKNQFILEYIDKLPTKGALKITFDPNPLEMENFTQLPATVINKIEHIGVIGLRLLFYYESFINRTDNIEKQFAFPSIETTSEQLGIDKETVMTYNKILKKNKLIRIKKHKLENIFEYDDMDNIIFTKYNNHYYVNLDKL